MSTLLVRLVRGVLRRVVVRWRFWAKIGAGSKSRPMVVVIIARLNLLSSSVSGLLARALVFFTARDFD
jgi:hypothetical protein